VIADSAEAAVLRFIAQLARRHLDDGEVMQMAWTALGLDSLDVLELAVRCEEEFRIEIPDRVLVRCHTPRDVVAYLSAAPERSDGVDHKVIGVRTGRHA
jgi:acyl carrier protein